MKIRLMILILFMSSLAIAENARYTLKLHKIIDKECRIMFFDSLDGELFIFKKIRLGDNEKFEKYKSDPQLFLSSEKKVYSYLETTGFNTRNHIVKLEEKSIVVKYDRHNESGNLVQ